MPLKKLLFKPGVNRENTRYTTEGGWYECDKVRFRQGTPEKIGGWVRLSASFFLGICRSLWNWVTLDNLNLVGIGTNLKFYIEQGGAYYDITPIRSTVTLNNPFTATNGSNIITVSDSAHGAINGDFVTFSGAVGLGGNITAGVLNREFQITFVDSNTFTIVVSATANATDVSGSPGGGASVSAAYQINVGPSVPTPFNGWGAGGWGLGGWGDGVSSNESLRLWSQRNFGEDLIFAVRNGQIYYWDATNTVNTRGVLLSSLPGALEVPVVQSFIFVSDAFRFVFAFGSNDEGSVTQDPMLIRWSSQEDAAVWQTDPTNQAGSLRLATGSRIVAAVQARQEIVVFTDSALYSLQYLGPPLVWRSELLGDNISIMGPNAASIASGVIFWMGIDKFYTYNGRVQTLRCDLRQYIFSDFNMEQVDQVFSGTNEGFNEVWWFYCSANSTVIDKYVIYNYVEDAWYYGTLGRTAWLDTGLRQFPIAATYSNNIVSHENGVDNNETTTTLPIEAYIQSSEFDIDDGHNFGFIWRILPDITFRGSNNASPQAVMYLYPLQNSGSGYNNPASVGGTNYDSVIRTATVPIEQFTGQINTRVRGRQLAFRVSSNEVGTTWQLGAPRIDIKPDGRR